MTNLHPLPAGVSPAQAAQELQRRRTARSKLIEFTRYTFPQYKAEAAHRFIGDTLDRVVNGEITRLMLFAPPQHGKSELVSVRFPPFWLAHHPDLPVIVTSYAASLAESKSKQARELLKSEEYARLFPNIKISPTTQATDLWALDNHKGYLKAAGVGGPITGHGAGLGIIDDPFEHWEQAQSQTYRDRAWDWYTKTFRTRIWENGAIIIIMTRWHQDDLAGRLLAEQPGEWTVIRLPAISESQEERNQNDEYLGLPVGQVDPLGREPGQPLCPERFSLRALLSLQKDVGPMGWAAEYQGVPRAAEGNRFKREWFVIVDQVPAEALQRGVLIRYWDNAATQDAGCYTAGVLLCVYNGIVYILDVIRGQWNSDNRNQVIKSTTAIDAATYNSRVTTWFEKEGGSSGVDAANYIIKMLAGYAVFADGVTGSKDVRLTPFEAQAAAGNVRLVKSKWNRDYIEELIELPNGTYRDQSDATSGAYNKATLGDPSAAEWIKAMQRRQQEAEKQAV